MASKTAVAAVVSFAFFRLGRVLPRSSSFPVDRTSPAFTQHLGSEKVRTTVHTMFSWADGEFLFTETIAALQAFRKRHSDAQRLQAQYASQPSAVDLAHYRSILKNKAIVDDAEKLLNDFKVVTYDVNTHIKAIEAFETKAVRPLLLSL
jgi:hypothetical protein